MLHGVQNNPGKFVLKNDKRTVVKRMEPNEKRVASRERPGEMCVRALESDPIRPFQQPESGASGRRFSATGREAGLFVGGTIAR